MPPYGCHHFLLISWLFCPGSSRANLLPSSQFSYPLTVISLYQTLDTSHQNPIFKLQTYWGMRGSGSKQPWYGGPVETWPILCQSLLTKGVRLVEISETRLPGHFPLTLAGWVALGQKNISLCAASLTCSKIFLWRQKWIHWWRNALKNTSSEFMPGLYYH